MKKKAPWPTLPLQIKLYEIKSLQDVDCKAKEIVRFKFHTKDINRYDPRSICKDHCVRVYFPLIYETFHWPKDDPWRYCYNVSRLNDLISLVRTQKNSLQITTTQEATTRVAVGSYPMQDKGKKKIYENLEEEKSCKMREDSIMDKIDLIAEEKREKEIKIVGREKSRGYRKHN